jgi:hypothetical protein
MTTTTRDHLRAKELAAALGYCTKTIYRAKAAGFKMHGGVATIEEWRAWHAKRGVDVPSCPKLSIID